MSVVFTISIDDGHPSDMKMAELLSKHELHGTFFIPIKNREGPAVLTKSEIRTIGDCFEIGSHTYDHCYLETVNSQEAHYQVTEGKKQLEDILGEVVSGFCYPGGKYRQRDVDIVKTAGFRYARTTMNLCFDTGEDSLAIPTTIQFYPHHRSVYYRNFIKAGNWRRRHVGLMLAVKNPHFVNRLYALFEQACISDGAFHLWAHSKDIDEMDGWSELDHFLTHVATKVAVENRLNNHQLASRFF